MVNINTIKHINKLALRGLNWFAPHYCLVCQQRSNNGTSLCSYCESAFRINTECCPHCALPFTAGESCPSCLAAPAALSKITAPYVYNPATAAFMHAWKYQKSRYLHLTVAKLMLKSIEKPFTADVAIATPLHWRRQLLRGFNQSEDLLAALRKEGGIHTTISAHRLFSPRAPHIKRMRHSPPQAVLGRSARLQQLTNAFCVRGDVTDKSVLLIDDVCTTGATGNAVARALLKAGAKDVRLWCLARTPAS